jgi:diguanylate cyclase (GGDEF)-like protein
VQFDVGSLLLAFFAVNLVFGVALAGAARRHPDMPGPAYWAAAALITLPGFLGIVLLGRIPDFLSIVVANTALTAGAALLWVGIRAFVGLSHPLRIVYAFCLADASLRILFTYSVDTLAGRQAVSAVLNLALALLVVRDLGRARPKHLEAEIQILVGVTIAEGLEQALRLLVLFVAPISGDYLEAGLVEGLHLFADLFIVSTRLLVLMMLVSGRLQVALNRLATHDALTDLPNRRAFLPQADREIERARRHGRQLAVLVLDLDHFKRVNDTRGHAEGDRVLRQVAALLRKELRGIDLPSRFGGEEFHLLLPDSGPGEAYRAADRLRERLAAATEVTASIGVAIFPDHGDDLGTLLVAADRALYRAKGAGRNRVEMAEVGAAGSGAREGDG